MKGTSLLALSSHISENIYNKIDGNIINTYSLRACADSEFHILRLLCNSVANDSTSLRPLDPFLECGAARQNSEQQEMRDHKITGKLQAQPDTVRSHENSHE